MNVTHSQHTLHEGDVRNNSDFERLLVGGFTQQGLVTNLNIDQMRLHLYPEAECNGR